MASPPAVHGLSAKTKVRSAAVRLLAVRVEGVRRLIAEVQAGHPEEAIHDLRVALRRLRAALVLFFGREQDRSVKSLADALGAVRDLQLRQTWLGAADLPRLDEQTREQLARDGAALDRSLRRFRRRTLPAIDALAPCGKGRLGGRRMRRAMRRRLRAVERRLARADSLDPVRAHDLRIAGRKLRYQSELLAAAFPPLGRAAAEELVPLQDALGALHDADAHLAALNAFLDLARPEEVELALVALAQLVAEREALRASAAALVDRFRRRICRELRRSLAGR